MAHIIAEPCIGTKDTACVAVCPVDCIHPTKDNPAFEKAETILKSATAQTPWWRQSAVTDSGWLGVSGGGQFTSYTHE